MFAFKTLTVLTALAAGATFITSAAAAPSDGATTTTGPATPEPTPACARSYTVQPGDFCDGISAKENVSTCVPLSPSLPSGANTPAGSS